MQPSVRPRWVGAGVSIIAPITDCRAPPIPAGGPDVLASCRGSNTHCQHGGSQQCAFTPFQLRRPGVCDRAALLLETSGADPCPRPAWLPEATPIAWPVTPVSHHASLSLPSLHLILLPLTLLPVHLKEPFHVGPVHVTPDSVPTSGSSPQ